MIERLGLPQSLFGDIVMPGTVRGRLKPEICEELGLSGEVEVIAVGSHDTSSAVFAVPQAEGQQAFLSSGTWSLLGVEVPQPILSEEAHKAGFTNEGGVGGKIRFLQNITGLWMLQRLMAQWKGEGKNVDYDYLLSAAEASDITSVIDVDDPFSKVRMTWRLPLPGIVIKTAVKYQLHKANMCVASCNHWHNAINEASSNSICYCQLR